MNKYRICMDVKEDLEDFIWKHSDNRCGEWPSEKQADLEFQVDSQFIPDDYTVHVSD